MYFIIQGGNCFSIIKSPLFQCDAVRDASLRGMIAMYAALSTAVETLPEQNKSVVRRVFIAKCDPLPENQALATQLWGELGLDVIPGLMEMVLEDVGHPVGKVDY